MAKFVRLMRNEDIHGNSGTGCVFTGMVFAGGQVAYMWKGEKAVMSWVASVDVLKDLHEHEGKGEVEVLDTDRYLSSSTLVDRFFDGESLSSFKLKPKYRPKEELKEGKEDEEENDF